MKHKLSKSTSILNEKTLLVGVDIGKIKNSVYCQLPDGQELKVFSFPNTGKGIRSFWNRIETLRYQSELSQIVVGLEPTGCYGVPLIHFLKTKPGVRIYQVNPTHTKRVKELTDNSPEKSDEKDPKVIADIMRLGRVLKLVIPEGIGAQLRHFSSARQRLVERRAILYRQLEELVFSIFPEFDRIMKGLRNKSSRYLLGQYPLPGDIVELGIEQLSEVLHRVSRGRLGMARAKSLYQAAQISAGIDEGASSIVWEIQILLRHIELCDREISEVETQLRQLLDQVPESPYILSIKGIGEVVAAGLIGEVGDFSCFHHAVELQKLAGLDLYRISSGKYQGVHRISKRGRSLLRKLLYLAALSTVRKGGAMHHVYQRHLQKGMPKPKALVAVMRKLVRIIFALVRDQREFVQDYEAQANKKKAA